MSTLRKIAIAIICLTTFQCLLAKNGSDHIDLRKVGGHGFVPKTPTECSINASLDGNTVTVMFASDFGPVDITVETASGTVVASTSCLITPNDAVLEVPGSGNFTLTITTAAGIFTGQFTIN